MNWSKLLFIVFTLSRTRSGVSSAASVRASTISREEDVEHWNNYSIQKYLRLNI